MVAILEQNGAVPRAHKGDYEGGYLKGTYICGMSFLKANLMVANFRSADREGAEIHESYLIDTNFQGANLHKATIKASLANLSQKEAFGKVMTEEQINAMVWL